MWRSKRGGGGGAGFVSGWAERHMAFFVSMTNIIKWATRLGYGVDIFGDMPMSLAKMSEITLGKI